MDAEEESLLKEIILAQDIEFYHDYMHHLKTEFSISEPKKQANLMAIYHAAESVWCALLNLKSIIDRNKRTKNGMDISR